MRHPKIITQYLELEPTLWQVASLSWFSCFGFYCSADNQQKETLSFWKCPTLQPMSLWLSWEFSPFCKRHHPTWGSRSVSVHGILEYTFCSKGTLWYDLFSLHMITALHEHDLLCLPIDSLWWQLVEWQCQGHNIRM